MDRQLKLFFEFLANEKKASENTIQSYRRDLKQYKKYSKIDINSVIILFGKGWIL